MMVKVVLYALALASAGNVWAIWPFGGGKEGPFVIAENGEAKAAIVVRTEGREKGYRYAANELADYLGKMTGARFAVVNEPLAGLATIRVGTAYAPSKTDELHIEVKSSELLEITGDDALGTLYGVYDLLEQFGCRFYCMDYEKVPTTNRLELAAGYVRTDAPSMIHRENLAGVFVANDPRCTPFALKHRMTKGVANWNDFAAPRYLGLEQLLCNTYIPKNRFFDEKKHPESYHPDWYALRKDGTRCPHTLCASNDAMYEELFREVEKDIVEKHRKEISLGDDDGWEMCHCPGCEAITATDTLRGNGAQRIVLLNRVARHFAKSHPEVRFNILVYGHQCPEPAERFRLEPNAGLSFALLWRNHCRPVYACERIGTDVEAWLRLTDRKPEIWDYGCSFFCNATPFPNHDIFGANFRYYRDIGVMGIFSQMQYSTNGDLAELHHYLFDRLCWNPSLDDRALTEEFVRDVYGKSAANVLAYLDLCTHARDRQRWWWGGCYTGATDNWLLNEDCWRILELNDAIRRAAAHDAPPQRVHADRVRISMLYLLGSRYDDLLAVAAKRKAKVPKKEDLIAEYERLFEDGLNRLPWYGELGEMLYKKACLEHMRHIPETPSAEPAGKAACHRIAAADLDGGERRTLLKDPDGTPFVRLDPKPRGNEGRGQLYMDPAKAECGFVVGKERTGTWYVFATVRTAATVADDEASAFLGLYLNKPYVYDTHTSRYANETATMYLSGSKDRHDWRTFSFGKYRLYDTSRIWVMPGIVHAVDAVDVREFVLIAPERFDDEKDRKSYLGAGTFRLSRGGCREQDRIDRFPYVRLDAAAFTNGEASVTCAFTAAQAQGAAHVFARVRVGATVPKQRDAGRLLLLAAPVKGSKDPPAVLASELVDGTPYDDGWQIISLGRHEIVPGMTLVFRPGGATPLRFLDMRGVHLVPSNIE